MVWSRPQLIQAKIQPPWKVHGLISRGLNHTKSQSRGLSQQGLSHPGLSHLGLNRPATHFAISETLKQSTAIYLSNIGRSLTLLHGIFSTLMILFYTSKLRVYFITPQYEKPVSTFDDIIDRAQTVYIPTDFRDVSWVQLPELRSYAISITRTTRKLNVLYLKFCWILTETLMTRNLVQYLPTITVDIQLAMNLCNKSCFTFQEFQGPMQERSIPSLTSGCGITPTAREVCITWGGTAGFHRGLNPISGTMVLHSWPKVVLW